MTIALSANTPRISYTVAEGVTRTTPFNTDFIFFESSDISVFVDGVARTFNASTANTTQFTVSGGNGSTGSVTTTVTGATGGSTVVITRDIELKRTTDFPSSGAFEISKLNTELDTIIAITSDFNDSASRAIRLQDFDDAVSMELPLLASRKGTVLGFNATTGAVEAGPTITAVQSLADVTASINLLGTSDAVSDMNLLATSANVTAMGHLGTSANVTAMGHLGTSANVTAMGLLGTSSNVTNMSNLGTSTNVANMATLTASGVIANIATVAGKASLITSDFVSDLNELATTPIIQDLDLLATSDFVSDLNEVEGIKADVTTVANNLSGVNSFASRYRVASSAPSSSLDVGDLYFDTTANELKVYKSSGWAAAGSTVNGTSERFTYNITGTPTTLTGASGTGFAEAGGKTLAYDAGFLDVYLNGVKMVNGTDVTVTSGTSVVFASALSNGDVVDIVTFGTFNVAAINADNINSGTVPVARVSGSYTSITGTGALNAGSITSGFGNIDTGSSTITTTGAITGGTLTGTLQTAAQTNITSVGTLGSLSVSGDIGVGDDLNLTSDASKITFGADSEIEIEHAHNEGLKVQGSGTNTQLSLLSFHSTNGTIPDLRLGKSGSDTIGTFAETADGESIAQVRFTGVDSGGSSRSAAQITVIQEGSSTGSTVPASMRFSTTGSERMRIISTGGVLMNRTSSNSAASTTLDIDAGSNIYCIVMTANPTNGAFVRFHKDDGSEIGSIDHTASVTRYLTSSDHRLKENVVAMEDATTRLKQLQPKRFNFIADSNDTTVDGFLAHEVQSVVPEAVSNTHNEVEVWQDGEELPDDVSVGDNKLDDDGNTIPKYQGIDHSCLVPLLVKTIQELEARITALEGE